MTEKLEFTFYYISWLSFFLYETQENDILLSLTGLQKILDLVLSRDLTTFLQPQARYWLGLPCRCLKHLKRNEHEAALRTLTHKSKGKLNVPPAFLKAIVK